MLVVLRIKGCLSSLSKYLLGIIYLWSIHTSKKASTERKKPCLFRFLSALFLLLLCGQTYAQINLNTEDLPRFWQAFDSVMTTADTVIDSN
ncbi:hypothetical protein HMF3257_38315 [Spirosoma telluris]|uniref:Uncharacterized protein n=1 Tax=Spirosoma telluris TaxID=2183553 RepID=A0A327NG19_9BACT|nr:hypothetical protein HMF3257_38315 [Spirosoma telluris]